MNRAISKALSNPIVGILVIAICIIVLGFSVDDAFARRGGGRGGRSGGRVKYRGGRGSVSHHRSRARTPHRRSRPSQRPARIPERRPKRTPERSREQLQERRDLARQIRSERRDVAREVYDERWDRARRYAFWRAAVVGNLVYARPLDCTEVLLSGYTHYNCDGVYWRPYMEDDRVVYLVVEP